MSDDHSSGIAEPHQSMVTAIRRAAEQGRFSAAEADAIIDRVRTPPPAGVPTTRTERRE